jgi:hypothetical protein
VTPAELDAIEARARAALPIEPEMATTIALVAEVRKLREALAEVERAAHGGGPTAHRMLRVKQIVDDAQEPGA